MTSKPRKAPAKKAAHKPGRPSKLDPTRLETIVKAVAGGNFYETALSLAGVSRTQGYAWQQKGRDEIAAREAGREPDPDLDAYVEFAEAVTAARAQAEARNLNLIQKAAVEGTWQAAAWYLERTQPARYGRSRVEVTGANGGPVEHTVTVEDLESKIAGLLAETQEP